MIADLSEEQAESARMADIRVFPDFRMDHFQTSSLTRLRGRSWQYWSPPEGGAPMAPMGARNQNDVIAQIRAPAAWKKTRGSGVTIAIIDTGVHGGLAEIGADRHSAHSFSTNPRGDPWKDPGNHGSMCASIAAASRADGGRYDGVAPEATILSAPTGFWATEIYEIYDHLLGLLNDGDIKKLVVNNSYGLYRCSPLGDMDDHPYLSVVREMSHRAVVCFAAGNNHADIQCNHPEAACSPNSIWAVNSVDEVLTVGAVNENGRNDVLPWANSSRGPGEWSRTHSKPDVVAPCYGETVWGSSYRLMPWWGTSGACPQAAGLAALILSAAPHLSPEEVREVIKTTAKPLQQSAHCVGRGMIDCAAAVDAALSS